MLLVSGDADQLDMYRVAFRARGVDMRSVSACEPALDLLRDSAFSAVVVDVVSTDDWDTCARLADATGPATPIIVLSGWLSEDGRYWNRAFDLGCAAFVAKPALAEQLQTVVQRARAGERRVVCLTADTDVR